MKKAVIGSLLILLYVNLVPFISRLWKGLDWVMQYIPEKENFFLGSILFGLAASVAAVPLILAFLVKKHIPVTFKLSILVFTLLLAYWHHNYDLASDPQAAIGLLFIPIYVTFAGTFFAAISAFIEFNYRKNKLQTVQG